MAKSLEEQMQEEAYKSVRTSFPEGESGDRSAKYMWATTDHDIIKGVVKAAKIYALEQQIELLDKIWNLGDFEQAGWMMKKDEELKLQLKALKDGKE